MTPPRLLEQVRRLLGVVAVVVLLFVALAIVVFYAWVTSGPSGTPVRW